MCSIASVNTIWDGNRLFGIDWHIWKLVGWVGNTVFFTRFLVQWVATEKRKKVFVPISFWWLSLIGSLLLLIYGVHQRDSVFIFAYAFTWIPYIRNILIHYRNKAAIQHCCSCGTALSYQSRFCHGCGLRLADGSTVEATRDASARKIRSY